MTSRSAPNLQTLPDLEPEHDLANNTNNNANGNTTTPNTANGNRTNGERINIVFTNNNNANSNQNTNHRDSDSSQSNSDVYSENNHNNHNNSKSLNTNFNHQKYSRPGRPKHAALLELFYGGSVYLLCVFLPSFPRCMYQLYLWTNSLIEQTVWYILLLWHSVLVVLWRWGLITDPVGLYEEAGEDNISSSSSSDGGSSSSMNDDSTTNNYLKKAGNYLFSTTSTFSLWEEFNTKKDSSSMSSTLLNSQSSFSTGYSWGFGRHSTPNPSIAMVLYDIKFLTMLAVTLAIIRVWLVHMLVPEYLAPRRLEALTRCKSSHLLSSSSYRFGGVRGWENALAERGGGSRDLSLEERLGKVGNMNDGGGSLVGDDGESEGQMEKNGLYDRMLVWISDNWYKLRPSIRRALGHEPSARYNDIPIDSSATPYTAFRRANSKEFNTTSTQNLFSAPRHATATFRLLYTSISCLSALIFFHAAEFWPPPLFGTHPLASTRHCWDLRGTVVALGFLDGDYDDRNGALRYFFLAQAAYQLHSLCFHWVSMILLILYGGGVVNVGGEDVLDKKNDNGATTGSRSWFKKFSNLFLSDGRSSHHPNQVQQQQRKKIRLISMKTSMQSYARPMLEHVIVLALLVGSYSFSGLRRLGALGIFTLEVSSVFLQLLQVCIYAPEESWWRRPNVIIFVHRFLTIPTFVYCRFFVLPFVVWYSAAFESQEWLEQIEKVFSPGWGERIYTIFNGLLFLIFALNLVLFRRLLFHPHLRQIVKQKSN